MNAERPELTPQEGAFIEAGKKLSALEGTEGYQAFIDGVYSALSSEIMGQGGIRSPEDALRSTARVGLLLETINAVGSQRAASEAVEQDFRARYEAHARGEFEAQRRSQRGGVRAGRASSPSL